MNIDPRPTKPSLADDLTVVFLRGNGSPRTFRVPVDTVQRSLTTFGFAFSLALLAALFFLGLHLLRPAAPDQTAPATAVAPPITAPDTATPTETPAPTAGPGIWQKITGSPTGAGSAGDDSELRKEVDGLRQDIARLNAQIDARKELPKSNSTSLLQLFGPRAAVMTENETSIRVRNPKLSAAGGKEITLTFELHNTDPAQKQERGYIVALAKMNDSLLVYPPNAFSPSQNIVLDFTKGETFGVSRFREARAVFPAAALAGKQANFQILLFSTDGRIIANQHVEEKP